MKDEMLFDIRSRSKRLRVRDLKKNYFNKRGIFASGLQTIFLLGNPNELCDKLNLLVLEKRAGNNSNIIKEEFVAKINKLLQYKCFTATQHKKVMKSLVFYKICDSIS